MKLFEIIRLSAITVFIAMSVVAVAARFDEAIAQDSGKSQPTPPTACMSQADLDAAIAKASDELSDITKKLNQAEADAASDQKRVDSWQIRMGGEGNQAYKDLKESLANKTVLRDSLRKQRATALTKLSTLLAMSPCPPAGAAPPPIPPTGTPQATACKTLDEIDDEIESATEDLLDLMSLVREADEQVRADQQSVNTYGPPKKKDDKVFDELQARLAQDIQFRDFLVQMKDRQVARIAGLNSLVPCPPPRTAPQPATPQPPPAGLPPCYDEAAQMDLVLTEKLLADVRVKVDDSQAAVSSDEAKLAHAAKGSAEAQAATNVLKADRAILIPLLEEKSKLLDHITKLQALLSCPSKGAAPIPAPRSPSDSDVPPAKPSKSSNDSDELGNILGHVTIGVGVGGGHDNHRDSGHTEKAPKDTHPADTPPTDTPETTSPPTDAPHDQ